MFNPPIIFRKISDDPINVLGYKIVELVAVVPFHSLESMPSGDCKKPGTKYDCKYLVICDGEFMEFNEDDFIPSMTCYRKSYLGWSEDD